MSKKTRPDLGAKVRITGRVWKVRNENTLQAWEEIPGDWTPIEGVYVGYRFKQYGEYYRGYPSHFDMEGGSPFLIVKGTQEVWLVVLNPRHEPVTVFPEQVEILPWWRNG